MRVEKYLFKNLMVTTFWGSIVALALLVSLQVLRLSDVIVKFDLGFVDVFLMLGGLALSFVPLVLPIAFLFSLLIVFGQMATDKELVALFAMGHRPMKILRAPFVLGAVLSVGTVLATAYLGPLGNQQFEKSLDAAFKRRVASALRSGTFSVGFLDMVIFVDNVNPSTQELERIFVFDESSFKEKVAISARRGKWIQSPETGVSTLKLDNGVLISQNPETQTVKRVDFGSYQIHADFSRQTGVARNSPPSLTLGSLLEKRAHLRAHGGEDPRGTWVELWRRFALGFLPLFFVPLAFGLSANNQRTARSQATFWGLLIIFSYWTIYFSIVTWILKGKWEPLWTHESLAFVGTWIPTLVVGLAGIIMLRRRLH